MGKNKLKKFAENETFSHVFQPQAAALYRDDFEMKGRWSAYFGNQQPLVLELGCGKGEYTLGLAARYPEANYIGVDIKGARIWRAAKTVSEQQLRHVAFLRTKIQAIDRCFAPAEVSEIWITFADPQPKKENKRLTSPEFLDKYRAILRPGGRVHLKTDSDILYDYTLEVIAAQGLTIWQNLSDVYAQKANCSPELRDLLGITTYYESLFAPTNSIKYLCFGL